MTITANKVVSFHYQVKDNSGNVVDSSDGREPLTYLHGHHNIIPGLENAMLDKVVGDKFQAVIPPAEAYGDTNPSLINDVPAAMFQGVDKVEPGMGFTANTEQGPMEVMVVEVNGDMVKVDANHPLAGHTLTFDVEVLEVRDASDEELAHGHAHGAGGHQH